MSIEIKFKRGFPYAADMQIWKKPSQCPVKLHSWNVCSSEKTIKNNLNLHFPVRIVYLITSPTVASRWKQELGKPGRNSV